MKIEGMKVLFLPKIPRSLILIFLVIMISGGYEDLKSAEIYDLRTRRSCFLPSMPANRYSTVTKEFLVCGGYFGPRDCIIFNNGVWENAHKLNQDRIRYNLLDTSHITANTLNLVMFVVGAVNGTVPRAWS